MEEKIKQITARYLRIQPEQITALTPIGRTAVESSILIHRMYAMLAEEGMPVSDYTDIETFGQLLSRIPVSGKLAGLTDAATYPQRMAQDGQAAAKSNRLAAGIDIESVDALPVVADFREDHFYQRNFSGREIAHCILQPNPVVSFAGLFAAKEALVKAGVASPTGGLGSIEITHTGEGRPVYPGFSLSIAHTGHVAVAIAIPETILPTETVVKEITPARSTTFSYVPALAALALLISLAALVIALVKS